MNLKEKTVVIDNKNYRYSKIVMLSSNEKANRGDIILWKNQLFLTGLNNSHENNKQHLYFLSTDKICEGDWFYINGKIYKCHEVKLNGEIRVIYNGTENYWKQENCLKITATTNPECNLPKPSDSFLQVYIDAYNKNETIEECLVEYETGKLQSYGRGFTPSGIKTTKGEITIRKVKENWDREEVITLINKYEKDMCYFGRDTYYDIDEGKSNWISENL